MIYLPEEIEVISALLLSQVELTQLIPSNFYRSCSMFFNTV